MKSTIKVSISRSAFHLDSEAYEALCNYLNCLEKHFEGKEGGKEIVSDIEARIAELLSARIDAPDQVITPTMVEEVIGIMGRPDDMDDHAEYSAAPPLRWGKRLYRDVNNKMIGGVCSGLAAYFNIDVVFPRLFFAFIFIGYSIAGVSFGNCISLLVYLVLWIVIAPARSVREKIEMQGNNFTISAIQKKVEEEISILRQKWEKKGKEWTPEMEAEILSANLSTKRKENLLLRVVKGFLRLFAILLGVMLLAVALCGLIALPIALFTHTMLSNIILFDVLDFVAIGINSTLCKIVLLLAILLPLLGLVYIGIKVIVGFRSKFKIGLVMFLLWLVTLVTLVALVGSSALKFSHWSEVEEVVEVAPQYDTLYVNISDKYYNIDRQALVQFDEHSLAFWMDENEKSVAMMWPKVEIKHVNDQGPIRIAFNKAACGKNLPIARKLAAAVSPVYTLRDSLFSPEPFIYSKDHKWSGEKLVLRIYVPEGKAVKVDGLIRPRELR